MADPTPPGRIRDVDPAALERTLRRWAAAEQAPWLHAEVARRMAERLAIVKRKPATVVDWFSSSGASRELLRRAYPQARVVRVEAGEMQARTSGIDAPGWLPRRWSRPRVELLVAPAEPALAADLVWANMMLHAIADPQAQLREWQRWLADGGFLMFSTLGPGTLRGLREVYARAGWPPPHAPFVDMHDLGDMLVSAGFADPVMDQETLTLTFNGPRRLLDELRTVGSNASPQRPQGLSTPRWRDRLLEALGGLADAQGRLCLDFELVYGHAFKVASRPRVEATTAVPLDELRRQVRERRRPGSE